MNTEMQNMCTGQLNLGMSMHICDEFNTYSTHFDPVLDPATTLEKMEPNGFFC